MEKKRLALCVDIPAKTRAVVEQYCDITVCGEYKHGRGKVSPAVVRQECRGFELVALGDEKADAETLRDWAESGMKFISCGKGTPVTVDNSALKELGIPLCHAPGRNAVAVAEYTMALMLDWYRKTPLSYAGLKSGEHLGPRREDVYDFPREIRDVNWGPLDETSPQHSYGIGSELYGSTLGIVGFGAIGKKVAGMAKGFNMEVIAYDPYCPAEVVRAAGVEPVESLDEFLPRVDILSVHLPVTPETEEMIDKSWFARMKSSAILVNTARAKVIHQRDFVEAIQSGAIAGAAMDVCWEEPIPENHPLLKMKNVIITPHMAGVTTNFDAWTGEIVAQDILHYCKGEPLEHVWRR